MDEKRTARVKRDPAVAKAQEQALATIAASLRALRTPRAA